MVQEEQHDPMGVFVWNSFSYVGRSVVAALSTAGHIVYTIVTPNDPAPQCEAVGAIQDALARCNAFVIDIRDDSEAADIVLSALESVTTKVKLVLISTLMTWALTPVGDGNFLNGDDWRKRRPHPMFRTRYDAEVRASRLAKMNRLVELNVVSCGFLYGEGEDELFGLFYHAWEGGVVPIVDSGAQLVPLMHIRDFGQLVLSTLRGEMIDRYVLAVEQPLIRQREMAEIVAKSFGTTTRRMEGENLLGWSWPDPEMVVRFQASLPVVNELLIRVKCSSPGFVAGAEQVKAEFLGVRGLSPLRVLISGPPLVGKSCLAKRLSLFYELPIVAIDNLIAGAQSDVTAQVLLDLIRARMGECSFRNRGCIFDGIPSNAEFAEALFAEVPAAVPTVLIDLEGPDSLLRERSRKEPTYALGLGSTEEFDARLNLYRGANPPDETHLCFSVPPSIRAVTIETSSSFDPLLTCIDFIGPPHNLGKSASFLMQSVENEIQRAHITEPSSGVEPKREQMAEVETNEELRLFARFAAGKRDWLIRETADALAQGIAFVLRDFPKNPIQMLGCFIGTLLPPDEQENLMSEFRDPEEEEEEEGELSPS